MKGQHYSLGTLVLVYCVARMVTPLEAFAEPAIPGYVTTSIANVPLARSVTVDSAGNVYAIGMNSGDIVKITPFHEISLLVSLGAQNVGYEGPHFDPVSGDLFVSEFGSGAGTKLHQITLAGSVTDCVTNLSGPGGLASDSTGNIYVGLFHAGKVSRVPADCNDAAVEHNCYGGLSNPDGLAFNQAGDLLVANRGTNQILRCPSPCGSACTVFASGFPPGQVVGEVAFDMSGALYTASSGGTLSEVNVSTGAVTEFGTGFQSSWGLSFFENILYVADLIAGKVYEATPTSSLVPHDPGAFLFVNVADDTGQLLFDNTPVINNAGTVAFYASEAGTKGLFIAKLQDPPQPPNTIDHSHKVGVGNACPSGGIFTDLPISYGMPAISEAGADAFTATCGGIEGVYRHDPPASSTPIVISDTGANEPPGAPPTFFFRPFLTMNTGGTVAYTTMAGSSGTGIYLGNDSGQTPVVDISGPPYNNLGFPFVNDGGTVAFLSALDGSLEESISKAVPGSAQICADNVTAIDGFNFRSFGGSTAINASGVVAFVAILDSGGRGLYRTDCSGPITAIEESVTQTLGPAAINGAGNVAYFNGNAILFAEASGPPKEVLAIGDNLSFTNSAISGVVTQLGLAQGNFLNSSDQIALRYSLDDGTTGIGVAPEPSFFLSLASGFALVATLARRRTGIH